MDNKAEGRRGRESDCFLGIEERGRGTEKERDLFSLLKRERWAGRERERERERDCLGGGGREREREDWADLAEANPRGCRWRGHPANSAVERPIKR